jgi:hypothetical protein
MKMKPWIITGVSLLCAGAICCGAAVHAGALDQKRYMKMLDLTDYTDTPDGAFSSVLMDIESADVTVQNGSALSVAAKNVPEDSYSVTVENDTLHIQMSSNNEPWYSFTRFGFHPFSAPRAKITVTLPDAEYQAVAVANSSGDCTVSGISVSTLSLDLDYGDLTAKNTEVQNLCKVKNDAGDINLTDFSCGSSEMELEYGDLKLKKFTETDKTKSSAFTLSDGDVRCETSTLWNSSFDMDFGDIQTTDTALYGNTAISMDYGDVRLNLHGSNADYNVGYSYAAGSLNGSSPNQIAITGDQTLMDSSVTFTE